ncbi:hypothetical protein Goshw_026517, partial [Gossypium schwendimanii]|nr:hypothetical protein [Gossypium schwendimanii]
AKQGGSIVIVTNAAWFEPISSSTADKLAAEKAHCFTTNWFLDPIVFRRYPPEMQSILGSILPEFSKTEKEMLKKGLKGYGRKVTKKTASLLENMYVTIFFCLLKCHNRLTNQTDMDWLYVYPEGMEKIITYVKKRFNNTPMIIIENGYSEVTKANSTIKDSLQDVNRAKYMAGYLDSLSTAI